MSRSQHQEIELKRLLGGEAAADRLVCALGAVASDRQQRNHVFDTEGLALQQSRLSVRLRNEDGRHTLTAKGPSLGLSASVTSRTEAEVEIDAEVAAEIRSGLRDPVAVLRERLTDSALEDSALEDGAYAALWSGIERARGAQSLREVGYFDNRRRTIPVTLPSGVALQVEVDQTRFPDGRVEEEVEVELPGAELVMAVEAWLDDVAARAGVETKPSSAKLARFYAALARAAR